MRKLAVMGAVSAAMLGAALAAQAATDTYNINGTLANSINSCFNIAVSLTGTDCSYARTRVPPYGTADRPQVRGRVLPEGLRRRRHQLQPGPERRQALPGRVRHRHDRRRGHAGRRHGRPDQRHLDHRRGLVQRLHGQRRPRAGALGLLHPDHGGERGQRRHPPRWAAASNTSSAPARSPTSAEPPSRRRASCRSASPRPTRCA